MTTGSNDASRYIIVVSASAILGIVLAFLIGIDEVGPYTLTGGAVPAFTALLGAILVRDVGHRSLTPMVVGGLAAGCISLGIAFAALDTMGLQVWLIALTWGIQGMIWGARPRASLQGAIVGAVLLPTAMLLLTYLLELGSDQVNMVQIGRDVLLSLPSGAIAGAYINSLWQEVRYVESVINKR